MAIQSLELLIQMSRFNFTIAVNNYWQVAIQLLEAPSPFILRRVSNRKETLTALTTDTQGNVSPKTTFMTPPILRENQKLKLRHQLFLQF